MGAVTSPWANSRSPMSWAGLKLVRELFEDIGGLSFEVRVELFVEFLEVGERRLGEECQQQLELFFLFFVLLNESGSEHLKLGIIGDRLN